MMMKRPRSGDTSRPAFPAEAADVLARLEALNARAACSAALRPSLDNDELLHVGAAWVALSAISEQLAKIFLADFGHVVPASTLLLARSSTAGEQNRLRDVGLGQLPGRSEWGYRAGCSATCRAQPPRATGVPRHGQRAVQLLTRRAASSREHPADRARAGRASPSALTMLSTQETPFVRKRGPCLRDRSCPRLSTIYYSQ